MGRQGWVSRAREGKRGIHSARVGYDRISRLECVRLGQGKLEGVLTT